MKGFNIKKYKNYRKYKNYIILLIIAVVIIYAGYEYYVRYFYVLKDPKKIRNLIMSYGKYSVFAFIILQIIQVVAFFIPGEVVQIAGGYIFGTLWGSIISLIGITIGSVIAFSISYFLGKPFIRKIIPLKQRSFFNRVMNLGKINYIVFLLYLIPGIPKDALAYICGISDITLKHFLIYSTAGRIPCIIMSAYFGDIIDRKNILILAVIAVSMTTLFALGVFKGEKIIKKLIKNK